MDSKPQSQRPKSQPYFLQTKQSSPKSKIFNSLTEVYSNMFNQASRSLMHLLEDLEYMFQRNHLNFKVKHHHNMLMRILTPHELLSQYHIIDNKHMFDEDAVWEGQPNILTQCQYRYLSSEKKKSNSPFAQLNQNASSQIKRDHDYQQVRIQLQKIKANSDRVKQLQRDNSDYNTFSKGGCRPLLPLKLEKNLAHWIIDKITDGQFVRVKEIADYAKLLAVNIPKFTGSSGWVHRFLMRYPKTREMINLLKYGNTSRIQECRQAALQEIDDTTCEDIKQLIECKRQCHENSFNDELQKREVKVLTQGLEENYFNDNANQLQGCNKQSNVNGISYQNLSNNDKRSSEEQAFQSQYGKNINIDIFSQNDSDSQQG